MNGKHSRSQVAGRVEFTNGEIVFRERAANRSTRYRVISYETVPDGSTVLMLLPAGYEEKVIVVFSLASTAYLLLTAQEEDLERVIYEEAGGLSAAVFEQVWASRF